MKESKEQLVIDAKKMLSDRLHLIEEKASGHLRVNGCDFWATTGKWYDPKKQIKGNGLRSFIQHIEEE